MLCLALDKKRSIYFFLDILFLGELTTVNTLKNILSSETKHELKNRGSL